MRKGAVIIWLLVLFSGIVALFWRNEWVYSLPTPVPANYHNIKQGDLVYLPQSLKRTDKPLFLHFFNPHCPCSRFNITHVKSLIKKYSSKATFVMVVLTDDKSYTAEKIQRKFDVTIPVLFDSSIAASCGVYSTPQAVIIDTNNKLYYRGNYNKSRYCTDAKSNYAQMALDSLLNKNYKAVFDPYALKAYGCQLPTCTK